MSEAKKRGLGRGLSALLGEEDEDVGVAVAANADAAVAHPGPGGTTQHIAITDLKPSPFQPRINFDDEAIDDLAASIREKGIIQPILVRASSTGETTYEIIAGERRWRAAQRAQLHEVPVLVRDFDDRETAEIALIENLQRQDLSPLEEAEGYNRLMSEFAHTQEALGQALGKSRSHIANSLRLLALAAPIKQMLSDKVLSAGHARALLGAENAAVRLPVRRSHQGGVRPIKTQIQCLWSATLATCWGWRLISTLTGRRGKFRSVMKRLSSLTTFYSA